MPAQFLITFGVLIFAAVVPYLEINASHVFNPHWPPHARFHEVWQLSTNCGIGLLCLWLAWAKNRIYMASVLVILVMGGVLVANSLSGAYGGSVLSGNLSKQALGMELAVFAATLAVATALLASALHALSRRGR